MIYDITRDLMNVSLPEGVPEVELTKLYSREKGDICAESVLRACLHLGTHCDAFCHFVENGQDIAQISLEHFIGKCYVLSVPANTRITADHLQDRIPQGTKRLILHGNGNSYLSPDAANHLVRTGVITVGTDAWSISGPGDETATHVTLLGHKVAVIEDLDLTQIPDGAYDLLAAPLKISHADGAFCRAVLMDGTPSS